MTENQEYPTDGNGNGNGNGGPSRTNPIIELIMTEGVQKKQIATECFYNFKSRSIILRLNRKYQNIQVDLHFDPENLGQSDKETFDILKSNGVTPDDITEVWDMIVFNHNKIMDHYNQQELEETSIGQQKRKERSDRFKNTPPREISVAKALMMHEAGTNVRVTGKLIGGSMVENMIEEVAFRCANCYERNILEDYKDTRPRLQSEISSVFDAKNLHKQMCKVCLSRFVPHEPDYKYVSARRIELHGTETSNDIPHINVYLFNNCTIDVLYNQQVKITGSIQQVRVKDKNLSHIFVGLESDDWYKNHGVNPIEPVEKIVEIELTYDDKKNMQEFLVQNKDKVLDALAKLVAPRHQGHENVKKALLMAAVNTGIDSSRKKRRIDMLLIGPTGLDKSGLASDAIRLVPGSKSASAADSTTNSLICVYDNDKEHFRFGPIPLANGKMLHVDEMGLMKEEDQQRILSSMQEGLIRFARFGINKDIEASASYIITANANCRSGKFRDQDKIDINEIPFLGPLLDRIDLVFVFRKEHDVNHLRNLVDNMTKIDDNYSEFLEEEGRNYQFLTKWIVRGKEFDEPRFSEEASDLIKRYFVNVRSQKDNEVSDRLWNRLRNLCRAVARLKHEHTVDAEDAIEVIEFYNEQLRYWSQIAEIPSDPRIVAYQGIVKRLTGQKLAFEFIELLKAVCKDNGDIDGYVEKIDEGERDWNVRTNFKIRQIREKFTKGLRDERILILSLHPLTLAWRETYTGDDKPIDADTIDSDSGDAGDVSEVDRKPNERNSDNSNAGTKPKTANESVNLDLTNITNITNSNNN